MYPWKHERILIISRYVRDPKNQFPKEVKMDEEKKMKV